MRFRKKQADDAMTALIDAVEGICWQLETIPIADSSSVEGEKEWMKSLKRIEKL